ncbi:MAG TPA: sensor histidine kinase, partial [Spirochaetia bacterium]|nr:sensor histidine kinase [Spirochaetia bacterium]
ATERYEESSVREYIESLVESMEDALSVHEGISLLPRVEDFQLPTKKLFPLGIIVNELVTNALKYAFEGREAGTVAIRLERIGPSATLEVRDDGKGLPEGFRIEDSRGFGITLVRMLAEQLGGTFSMESAGGTRAELRFPV